MILRLCVISLVAFLPVSAKPTAAELLDEIFRKPGQWKQMCIKPMPPPFEVSLQLDPIGIRHGFTLSDENLARLRHRRDDVVEELIQRFATFHKALAAGQTPNGLNPLLFDVVLELNAIETIPGMLKLEQDLHQRLEMDAKDAGASVPNPDLNYPAGAKIGPSSPINSAANQQLHYVQVFQRGLLSVMATMMRREKYQPLLESKMEKRYFEFLKKEADSPELRTIKRPRDVSAMQREWIIFDPIHGLPMRKTPRFGEGPISYTPEFRTQISQFGWNFQKERNTH